MDNLPDAVKELIYDYAYGCKEHWKENFGQVIECLEDINPCTLIEDYFAVKFNKKGLRNAIDRCLNWIDAIGVGFCEDLIMNNILDEMKSTNHRYYDRVSARFKHLQCYRNECNGRQAKLKRLNKSKSL